MRMSDGMFSKQPKILFLTFFFFFFFFFFFSTLFLTSTSSYHPSTQNLLYLSHDVHPDDYGSDCVDDDCC